MARLGGAAGTLYRKGGKGREDEEPQEITVVPFIAAS
jgi:hypothetical protein